MKVIGRYLGGKNDENIARGSYVAFDGECLKIETYGAVPAEKDARCWLTLRTSSIRAKILGRDGDYIDSELANSLVKEMVSKEYLDLDKYNLGFSDVWDTTGPLCIMNEFDENDNTIPLEVKCV